MKIFKLCLAVIMCLCGAVASYAADTNDSQGYPLMYVRGSFNSWSAQSAYMFTRQGETYTIHMDYLDGEFKISGDDWQLNYGAKDDNNIDITSSVVMDGKQNGANFRAANLSDVTISFDLVRDGMAKITFTVAGAKPGPSGISGTLPVLYINVRKADGSFDNEIIDKDLNHKNYFAGEYWLDLNGCEWMAAEGAESIGSEAEPLPLEIKARGNYTRTAFAKKPFKLKLGAKQKMLGLSKSKHFAILAHADDTKGYLRNFTGFNLGQRIGLPWTPSQQPVEVIINGDYRGLYFLTESIRVGDGRVPIEELDDLADDPALVSGGYLVELDNYDEDNQIRLEEKGQYGGHKDVLRITFDTPEEYSDLQRRFITDQFTAMNDAIGDNSDVLWSYMDIDDAARYYLVEELISHTEAYHGSTYLFRDRGEGQKWHFSPLWDCGNAFNGPTDGHFYDHAAFSCTWIGSMRLNDRFNEKVRDTWKWFMSSEFDGVIADIDAYVDHLRQAAVADRRRWKDAPTPQQQVCDNSDMTNRRNSVVNHLNAKIAWMKGVFGDYSGQHAEPSRDTTPAAPLPDYAKAGVENVATDAELPAPVYYNLQGMPVANPTGAGLLIEVRGTTTRKNLR